MRPFLLVAALAGLFATACYDSSTYCQSGPKYGTQCYTSGGQNTSAPPPADPPVSSNDNPNSKTSNTNR